MRIAFLNLPHPVQVIRRYMCSYNAPVFLFPPLELMSAATTVRDWGKEEVLVLDAIAGRLSNQQVLERLRDFDVDLVVTLLGFEILEEDIRALRWLRAAMPDVKFAAFGYYPTTFPSEIFELASLDFIFRGEPEQVCIELCKGLRGELPLDSISGLCYRHETGGIVCNPERKRLRDVDDLPHPDYGLVDISRYSEFLMPTPFAVLQSARGCPYPCNYCVRSYGQKLTVRTPEKILLELKELVDRFGLRSFRFIDDTFTAVPARTLEICEGIRTHFPQLTWSCLSRIDTIDEERAKALKSAGCIRVWLGIESGSERILKLYGKDYGVNRVPVTIDLLRKNGLEVGAFFMVGHPEETAEDFEKTSRLIRSLEIDYATVGQTVPYPGTPLYEQYREEIDFSLFPYRNDWKSPGRRKQLQTWEKRFFREMYFRPSYLTRHALRLLKNPSTTLQCGKALLPFVFGGGNGSVRDELI